MTSERINLHPFRIQATQAIDPRINIHGQGAYLCDVIGQKYVELQGYVMGSRFRSHTHKEEFVPRGWWQHLKMQLGLKWKSRRIVTHIENVYYKCCPHHNISFEKTQQPHIKWMNEKPSSTVMQE